MNVSKRNSRHYGTDQISQILVDEIRDALKRVSPYGSVEIFVQNGVVTQLTTRNIYKTVPEAGIRPKSSGK
jgi:hypothetical protein